MRSTSSGEWLKFAGFMFWWGLLWIVLAAALGCGASGKQKVLQGTLASLDAVKAGLEIYDKEHQIEMVKESESRQETLYRIQMYRSRRAPILEALILAYKAVAVAALNPDDTNVGEVLKMLRDLKDMIQRFKEIKDPEPGELEEQEEDEVTSRTKLVKGEHRCRRPLGMPSLFCLPGRKFAASSPAFGTSRFPVIPQSRLPSPRWL